MRTKYFSEARTSSRIQLSFGAASNQKLERNKKMPKTKNAEHEKMPNMKRSTNLFGTKSH